MPDEITEANVAKQGIEHPKKSDYRQRPLSRRAKPATQTEESGGTRSVISVRPLGIHPKLTAVPVGG